MTTEGNTMDRSSVTDHSHDVVPAEELGLDPAGIAEIEAQAQRFVDDGPWPGLQVVAARHGRLAMFKSFGTATERSRFETFSATKPVTNSALWMLLGRACSRPKRSWSAWLPSSGQTATTSSPSSSSCARRAASPTRRSISSGPGSGRTA
jgi:hypothetical protein